MKTHALIIVVCGGQLFAACGRVEPSDANDISRLALLDVANAIELVNDDRRCGFESDAAIAGQQILGEPGSEGIVIRRVDSCAIDLAINPEKYPYFGCDSNAGIARGGFKFSGTRTISGRLTGDDRNPVIPSSSEALAIDVERVEFSGFEIARKDKAGSLALVSGSVSGRARIGLAAAADDGLCRVATPNAKLEEITFDNIAVRFTNLLKIREVNIGASILNATNGRFAGDENFLQGVLVLDGIPIAIPNNNEAPLFDPEYSPGAFEATFACPGGQVEQPVNFQCGDINSFIAENTARISFLAFVDLVALVSNDRRCGFESAAAKSSATFSGTVGGDGALTHRVTDCTIELPEPVRLEADCLGNSDIASGKVTISAVKILRGTRTDDLLRPILPKIDAPLTLEITSARLENFFAQRGTRAGLISGSLSGKMVPRVAQGTTRNFCSVGTPIAELSEINLAGATVRLTTPTGIVTATTDQSTSLSGINGAWRGKENAMWGTLAVNGQSFSLPFDGAPKSGEFEPTYSRTTFAESWQCDSALARPISFDCSAELPVPETISRMSVGILGTLTSMIENDAACGFASTAAKNSAEFGVPTGDAGEATFLIRECAIDLPRTTILGTDCNGKQVSAKGKVVFRGQKRMFGYNTGAIDRQVVPTSQDGTEFDTTVELFDFTYLERNPNALEPEIGVHLEHAILGGSVSPRLALDRLTGACSKATPVSTFDKVGFKSPTELTILFPGLEFTTTVDAMSLNAQSGSKKGVVNSLSGSLSIGGETYNFPGDGSAPLDPEYDPAAFDRSFQCDPNLVIPRAESDCDFKDILALQTARYLPMVVQSVGTTVNNDGNCGLAIAAEQLEPYDVQGNRGTLGNASWRAPHSGLGACLYNFGQTHVASQDCSGRKLLLSGVLAASADLQVHGRVEEFRDNMFINPVGPDAPSNYQLRIGAFQNLRVAQVDPPAVTVQSLAIDDGSFEILFHPIMGYSSSNDDPELTYLIRTPINRISSVVYTPPESGAGRISLAIGPMKFNAAISAASVSGFSGAFNAEANHIEGSVTLDGRTIQVSDTLDPAYDQADFDARYQCTPDLREVVPVVFP